MSAHRLFQVDGLCASPPRRARGGTDSLAPLIPSLAGPGETRLAPSSALFLRCARSSSSFRRSSSGTSVSRDTGSNPYGLSEKSPRELVIEPRRASVLRQAEKVVLGRRTGSRPTYTT